MAKSKLEQLTLEFMDEVEKLERKYVPISISRAYGDAEGVLGVTIDFELENREVQKVLNKLAKNIRDVPETVAENVRLLIGKAAENGWSDAELTQHILDKGITDSPERALLISRTESATGYNLGSLLAYEASGVVSGVEVLDGTNDDICAAANGQTWTLEEARDNPIGHPNCVRAFSPIVG